jgi:hypothetical protein
MCISAPIFLLLFITLHATRYQHLTLEYQVDHHSLSLLALARKLVRRA